ncbi:DUF3347 domain-containing protein [Mucilaginibacter sp. ZT4R22]|uniref:DUF3347 domain-containing protein n=1 Tax=Mucilaginibacter pankratovii TaxID=2772110 RepID=A0ABR7WW69_9SPHI|nr:DUF3347 domain-containing protein [Mucilaginibacter pankratovii]MBD1366531.1 DUF3347 domain-containing protein [Mucilaginibacter pankratovii]
MKNLIIVSVISLASFSMVACNNTNKSSANSTKDTTASTNSAPATTAKGGVDPKTATSIKEMVGNYLQLKNALTKDNSNDAATAAKALSTGFAKLDQSVLTPTQKKSFTDIADDAKEMAEHIGMSGGKLPHQREHFDMLSKDMYDLVKLFGAGQHLFVDHCPMYNDKKGAIWLSEIKEIKNPYMGSGMSTCGMIQEEFK